MPDGSYFAYLLEVKRKINILMKMKMKQEMNQLNVAKKTQNLSDYDFAWRQKPEQIISGIIGKPKVYYLCGIYSTCEIIRRNVKMKENDKIHCLTVLFCFITFLLCFLLQSVTSTAWSFALCVMHTAASTRVSSLTKLARPPAMLTSMSQVTFIHFFGLQLNRNTRRLMQDPDLMLLQRQLYYCLFLVSF